VGPRLAMFKLNCPGCRYPLLSKIAFSSRFRQVTMSLIAKCSTTFSLCVEFCGFDSTRYDRREDIFVRGIFKPQVILTNQKSLTATADTQYAPGFKSKSLSLNKFSLFETLTFTARDMPYCPMAIFLVKAEYSLRLDFQQPFDSVVSSERKPSRRRERPSPSGDGVQRSAGSVRLEPKKPLDKNRIRFSETPTKQTTSCKQARRWSSYLLLR
jgi:hypothetical protein